MKRFDSHIVVKPVIASLVFSRLIYLQKLALLTKETMLTLEQQMIRILTKQWIEIQSKQMRILITVWRNIHLRITNFLSMP